MFLYHDRKDLLCPWDSSWTPTDVMQESRIMSAMGRARERKRTEDSPVLAIFLNLNSNFTYVKAWNRSCFTLDCRDLVTVECLAFSIFCVPSVKDITSIRNPRGLNLGVWRLKHQNNLTNSRVSNND